MTSGLETERGYSEGKDTGEVNKKGKYKQEKKEASYKKQKKASCKGNTHRPINNLYNAKFTISSRMH